MISSGYREEVLNVLLAQLLDEQGIISAPEQSLKSVAYKRKIPDVIVIFRGLSTAIEGKVDDHPGAADEVLKNARGRVEQGIAHIGIAVIYPNSLRQIPFHNLKNELGKTTLKISIISEAGEQGWSDGDINYLGAMLRRTFDQLIQEDVVNQAVAALDAGVETFAHAIAALPAAIERSGEILGIGELAKQDNKEDEE